MTKSPWRPGRRNHAFAWTRFAGTATTLAAAYQLDCHAVGIELNPAYIGYAVQRLSALLVPRGLAPAMEVEGVGLFAPQQQENP